MATTKNPPDAINASIFQRLHPRIYFERFVSENVRPDGRDFNAWRDVSVNVGMRPGTLVTVTRLTSRL